MGEMKQIRVTENQRDALHEMKGAGESYADILEQEFGLER